MASTPTRAINLARQMAAVQAAIPAAEATLRGGELVCIFVLQPTPVSRRYTVKITYRHRSNPRVRVIDPSLALHPDATHLPHVYANGDLCLYLPGEWNDHMFLSQTILPWTSAWLLHYELWLITGRWTGSGDEHAVPTAWPPTTGW
ncbi:hypothetical protein ABZ722_37935 [Streptomyces longwoodensis]|uniref:hypothetical protein n=1 Tax=Streptomyces longwoodensis TaxID=68231 RepID=UPI0033F6B9FB